MSSDPSSAPRPAGPDAAPAAKPHPSRSIASYLLGLIGRGHASGRMGTTNSEPVPEDAHEGTTSIGGDPAASDDLRRRRGEAFGTDRHHPAA